MCRSKWKLPYVSYIFFKKDFLDFSQFNTRIRNSCITEAFVDKRFRVYSGSKFLSFVITNGMIGKKLGEFSISKILGRNVYLSKARKQKAKKKKKK